MPKGIYKRKQGWKEKLSKSISHKWDDESYRLKTINAVRNKKESNFRKKKHPRVNKIDLSYIAGIMDGEGYIGIVRQREYRRRKHCFTYSPRILIRMCDKEAIDFISKRFTGFFSNKEGIQNGFGIGSGLESFRFLKAIIPYLKIKRKQAEIILKFIQRRIKSIRSFPGQKVYVDRDHRDYWQVRKLNNGGKLVIGEV